MPDINWNQKVWGQDYSWPDSGEIWSAAWGNSEAQWFGSLYPRLRRFLPAKRILEIAPGYGRWTNFLIPACAGYLGVDLAKKCIVSCRVRFVDAPHAYFICNDGRSLDDAPDASFDLIFSFDSLVHAEFDALEIYVPQLISKLLPGGVAFVHHSNVAAISDRGGLMTHARGSSVSATKVGNLITACGGKVLVQEVINWVQTGLIDCLSTFGRAEDFPGHGPIQLTNSHFMEEAAVIREFQSPYGLLKGSQR
jgi:SAM-dependent methyltransferase